MMFSIEDFFSKCDQIRRKLRIWSHLLKKSLMENFIFCAVLLAIWLFDGQLWATVDETSPLTQFWTLHLLIFDPKASGSLVMRLGL